MVRMNSSDKRKHFRFPAYDDETGVKLNRRAQNRRAQNNRRLDERPVMDNVVLDPVEMVDEPKFFGNDEVENIKTRPVAETSRSISNNIEMDEVRQLPDYSARPARQSREQIKQTPAREQVQQPVRQQIQQPVSQQQQIEERQVSLNKDEVSIKKMNNHLYAEPSKQEYKAPQSSFSNKFYETDQNGQAKYRKKYSGKKPFQSSYSLPGENDKEMFRPKYIPASLIEDEPVRKNQIEPNKLVEDLRNASSNNMLSIESTAESFDNTVEQTSEETKPKKNQRLEKSLSGIMEDEAGQRLDTYYFD